MNAVEKLLMADVMVKQAGMGNELAAGAAGMFGPLGAYAYAKYNHPNNEHARSDIVARNAIGSSIGALTGTAAGIPISMAMGVPVLPGVILSALLGAAGGGIGAGWASHRHEVNSAEYQKRKLKRQEALKRLKERRDPDNIETS